MLRRRTLVAGVAAASGVVVALIVALLVDGVLVPGASAVGPIAKPTPVTTCASPAPTTAAGYTALWNSIDPMQWGGADVSISVPLGDGRTLWLYGDTLSGTDPHHLSRFVHSTAIVQSRGCLHVSDGGAQLLPDVDRDHWYWIQDAAANHGTVTIRARLIARTGPGVWGFADAGTSTTFTATADAAGNVHLNTNEHSAASPAPDPGPMLRLDGRPHHFGYARVVHHDLPLAGGGDLVTTCQNWDGPGAVGWADYRPIFSSTSS